MLHSLLYGLNFLRKFFRDITLNSVTVTRIILLTLQTLKIVLKISVGREGFEPSNPAMSRQFDSNFWESYDKYLRNNVSAETAKDRMLYGRKYHGILITEDANELLTLNTEKRVHVMKSLASMSKYMGCYHRWKGIREKYN